MPAPTPIGLKPTANSSRSTTVKVIHHAVISANTSVSLSLILRNPLQQKLHTRLLEPIQDIAALMKNPSPGSQEERAIMNEAVNTSTEAADVGDVKASMNEMHHVSLDCRIFFEVTL